MNSEGLMNYYRGLFQNLVKRNKKLKSAKEKLREENSWNGSKIFKYQKKGLKRIAKKKRPWVCNWVEKPVYPGV